VNAQGLSGRQQLIGAQQATVVSIEAPEKAGKTDTPGVQSHRQAQEELGSDAFAPSHFVFWN
jgi:hypothetical protein